MRVSVLDDRQLLAVTYGLRALPRTTRNSINRATTATLGPLWKALVTQHATKRMDALVLVPGTRVKGGNPPVLLAAQSRRGIGKARRLVPRDNYATFEFGVPDPGRLSVYQRRSKNGGTHKVVRHASTGLRPRNQSGYVVYPALAEFVPRAVSLWVQTFMRGVYDAFEGKTS